MKTVVKDLFRKQDEFGGKEITVSGWIRNIRISKNFGFIELNDGTFFKNLQIVIESDKLDNFAELSKLNIAAAITATGTLVLTPDAKQPFELKAENVVIDGESTPDYPLQKKRHSFEYLRTVAHLRPAYKYILGSVQSAFDDCVCNSPILPGERICIRSYSDYHCK